MFIADSLFLKNGSIGRGFSFHALLIICSMSSLSVVVVLICSAVLFFACVIMMFVCRIFFIFLGGLQAEGFSPSNFIKGFQV